MGKTIKEKLSVRQQKILEFLNEQIKEKGYPPSLREICVAVGLKSTSTVHNYLESLEKSGFILRDPTKPRAIKILIDQHLDHSDVIDKNKDFIFNKEMINVPIVGSVAAGQPILAHENIEDTFPVSVNFVGDNCSFMLRVKGESMIEAGIFNDDYILVRQQSTANNGDIVVALLEDEATVKTFYKEKDFIRLQPENSSMQPIIVKEGLTILGKVIGLFRAI